MRPAQFSSRQWIDAKLLKPVVVQSHDIVMSDHGGRKRVERNPILVRCAEEVQDLMSQGGSIRNGGPDDRFGENCFAGEQSQADPLQFGQIERHRERTPSLSDVEQPDGGRSGKEDADLLDGRPRLVSQASPRSGSSGSGPESQCHARRGLRPSLPTRSRSPPRA